MLDESYFETVVAQAQVCPRSAFGRALVNWLGAGYLPLAKTMRLLDGRQLVESQWRNACRVLTRWLYARKPLTEPLTVYSGLGKTAGARLLDAPAFGVLRLSAATSTTTSLKIAGEFARKQADGRYYVLRLTLSPGTRTIYLDTREKEWLLPAGTRIELTGESEDFSLPVIGIDEDGDDYYDYVPGVFVDAVVVGQTLPAWALAPGETSAPRWSLR